ncbi:MAG: enoyl-CoA hydratase-related protein [Thermodesulfobacteriota bacterium]|nr:enoyl-CoA hydratase-related protein [Thermodesulfobacteriota bacterium]
MGKTVRYEIDNEIALLTLDNPPVNAFTQEMIDDISVVFKELKTKKLRVLIVTGAGRAFQAGADINMFLDMKTEEDGYNVAKMSQEMINNVADMDCPVIAAVNGLALGGGTEFSLACDIRIASSAAVFGLTEVVYGVLPGGGGTQRMPRLIGPGRAKMLILSGKVIDADEAFTLGLVDSVVEPDQLMPEVMKLAKQIAGKSPAAVKWAKKAINDGLDVPLADGLMIEREYLGKLVAVGDQIEGATAFLEKRKPNFVIK